MATMLTGKSFVTPRFREKMGQYLKEGDLICEIEDPDSMELEVPMDEQDVARIAPDAENGCEWHIRLLTRLLDYPVTHEVFSNGAVRCCRYLINPVAK